MNIDDYADEAGLELLRLEPRDQFDPCIVGIVERFNQTYVLYDKEKVLEALQADGLSEEDAMEHFGFNIAGAWVGDATPGFLIVP